MDGTIKTDKINGGTSEVDETGHLSITMTIEEQCVGMYMTSSTKRSEYCASVCYCVHAVLEAVETS